MALTDKLTAIADAIRAKTGKSGTLTLDAMPAEIASISGGGSTDAPFPFGGTNPQLVAEYSESFSLADTSFVIGESASTSATSIKASVANRFTNATGSPNLRYGDNDVVIVQTINAKPIHGAGATDVARQLETVTVYVSWFSKRKTSDTSAKTTRQAWNLTAQTIRYFNSGGADARTGAASYGFYGTPQTPTFASGTSASTYARVGSPILYYRVSSTYESAANIKTVTDCVWDWNVKVYTVDPFSTVAATILDLQEEFFLDGAAAMSLDDAPAMAMFMMDEPYDVEEMPEEDE